MVDYERTIYPSFCFLLRQARKLIGKMGTVGPLRFKPGAKFVAPIISPRREDIEDTVEEQLHATVAQTEDSSNGNGNFHNDDFRKELERLQVSSLLH